MNTISSIIPHVTKILASKLGPDVGRKRASTFTLLTCIREAPGSNLGQDTNYSDQGFSFVFLTPHKQIPGQYLKLRAAYIFCRDSSVGVATRYWLDDRGVGVRVPVGSRIFTTPCCPGRL
jgi:hypothetical protein